MKTAALIATAVVALSGAPAQAAPPLCRDAKAGAAQYSAHMIKYMDLDGPARYHRCGRWHGDPRQLWFSFSTRDELIGPASWWVRATWHETRWHYYNLGVNVDFSKMPNVELQVESS